MTPKEIRWRRKTLQKRQAKARTELDAATRELNFLQLHVCPHHSWSKRICGETRECDDCGYMTIF